MCVQQAARDLIVPVGNRIGFDDDLLADHAFDGEAPAVDDGTQLLDDDAAAAVGREAPWAVSGWTLRSSVMPSGGSVSDSVWYRPCVRVGAACTPPKLPWPSPPYSCASLFSTSCQKPPRGAPMS